MDIVIMQEALLQELARILQEELENDNPWPQGMDRLLEAINPDHQLLAVKKELEASLARVRFNPLLVNLVFANVPQISPRLDYVIRLMEEAADKSLSSIEAAIEKLDEIKKAMDNIQKIAASLPDHDQDFYNRQCAILQQCLSTLCQHLFDVIEAQSFQDLVGQVIIRLALIVQDLDQRLRDILKYRIEQEASNELVSLKKWQVMGQTFMVIPPTMRQPKAKSIGY